MLLTHRVHTAATPAQVWAVVGNPQAWPSVEPFLRGVRGRPGRATAGQHLMILARFSTLAIPVNVLEAIPESRLVLLVRAAPGLREQLTYELTPSVRGGCDITISLVVDGAFAGPALLPLWLAAGLTALLLAARTDRDARSGRRSAA